MVDELGVFEIDVVYQVVGVELGVVFFEYVVEDYCFVFGWIGVVVEWLFCIDFVDQQVDFVFVDFFYEVFGVVYWMVVFQVVVDDGVGGWGEVYCIVEIEYIGEVDVVFVGSVEFGDLLDFEVLFEFGLD